MLQLHGSCKHQLLLATFACQFHPSRSTGLLDAAVVRLVHCERWLLLGSSCAAFPQHCAYGCVCSHLQPKAASIDHCLGGVPCWSWVYLNQLQHRAVWCCRCSLLQYQLLLV
jgi:hypothetical protein